MRGLPALRRAPPGALHPALAASIEYGVGRHGNGVVHALGFEEVQNLWARKAAIESHQQPRLGERRSQPLNYPRQNPDRPQLRRRVARPQHVRKQILLGLGVKLNESRHRQVAPGVVVAVEQAQLLRAVRRIVGGIEFYRDAPGLATQTPALALDYRLGQRFCHPIQRLGPHRVLETRQRRLRGECLSRDRIAPHQQLLDRVLGQARRVVAVRVPAGDCEHPLADQIIQCVPDLARLTLLAKAAAQSFGQPQPLIARLEQHRAAIGTAMRLIKLRHHALAEQRREQNTLCCAIVSHAKAPSLVNRSSRNGVLP